MLLAFILLGIGGALKIGCFYFHVFIDLIQFIKVLVVTASIAMGMKEWFAPQISEHWP